MNTCSDRYKNRNVSGVYSSMMDYMKYHLLDITIQPLSDLIIQHQDAASYKLLLHV